MGMELLQQRDDEYQAKVSLEKQREKDRSIALLKKKEQELQIKDQQLQAAKKRVQELETGCGAMPGMSPTSHASRGMSPKPSSRTSTGSTRRGASLGAHQGSCGGEMLPPL